jgi:hypothetical protein
MVASLGSSCVIVLNQIERQRFARVTLDPHRVTFRVGVSVTYCSSVDLTRTVWLRIGAPVAASTSWNRLRKRS